MAKTMTQDKTSSDQDSKKQRKKLAKEEARLMLKVEEAKKAAQKAESKVAKAQAELQNANDKLRALEDQLAQLRGNEHQHSQKKRGKQQQDQSDFTQKPTNQIPSEPPAEGRTDIPQQSADTDSGHQSSFANAGQGDELEIDSDDGSSMPILTDNPQAWPPPQTRQEVAEGVVDEVQHPHSSSSSDTSSGGTSENDMRSEVLQAGPDQTQLEQHYGKQSE